MQAAQPEEVYMDNIIHKLQLLNYEREFCRKKKPYRKSLTPTYFSMPHQVQSGNEQFFYFTSLAAWLLQSCGMSTPTPKEFDDPNATLQAILQGLRSLGFASPSYPPTKLNAGYGKEVCAVLDGLLDVTLERKGMVIGRPVHQEERYEEEVADEGDMDDAADIATMAAQEAPIDEEEEAALALGGDRDMATAHNPEATPAADTAAKAPLVSSVDPMQWKLEVERVAPKLRLVLAADMRDWRQHLEAAHSRSDMLTASWPDTKAQLNKLAGEVTASLEKVDGRDRQLNSQFEALLVQYQSARQQMTAAQEEYDRRTELISECNSDLHRVAAALEDVKQQLDSKGSNLSDASPLVRLKAAMNNLRSELRHMEVCIGVVAHNLMSLNLRDKQSALQDAASKQQRGLRDMGIVAAAGRGGL
eukprot:GHRR01036530.1.p1 GENE.GHRR01036530.1~~GHRR01036530.1.p1  ORF type:complete len:417 (+),score=164.74 GHRR01036530.1:845-2095(+)